MGSIAFDQAADYYDRTRRLDPDVHSAVIDLLVGELRGRGRCLEVGVGTGRIALDLHRADVPIAGVDLSRPMLDRLVEKGGGTAPFPLAVADATALPAPSHAFGAAVACHVLHLIPQWRAAADELVRVVAPGGVVLVDIGGDSPGTGREISRHFFAQTRLRERVRPGLNDPDELDALMAGHGLVRRLLPSIVRRVQSSVEHVIRRLEEGILSGCWPLDGAERRLAGEATREWARQRFGAIDAPFTVEAQITWRAYDVPIAR